MTDYTTEAYNRKASTYEQRWESYLRHTHKEFLDSIETGSRDTILDLSCGTGLLARKMINHDFSFSKMVLNDPSANMLAIARRRLSHQTNVEFTNYKVEELQHAENQFERMFCLNAFHFYSEQVQIIKKIHALLKPGGTFYILDWNRSGFFIPVNQIIRWSVSERINTRSLPEAEEMLWQSNFSIRASDEWNWRYWKFFFVEAKKEVSRDL